MSDNLLENLENILKEEKWTRTTINNYTIKNFEELNDQIDVYKSGGITKEVLNLTEDYLRNNKNSIVALYINSIINFDEGNIDDTNILSLIKIFTDNLKWNIVEYLCKKTLYYFENKHIIRTLIDTYNNTNKKDDLPALWERLIKADFEEADTVLKLANYKEENGEEDEAKNLYKKAINRFIHSKNFIQVEELWKKILTYEDMGYEYFFNLDKKVSKNFSDDRSIELLKYLYEVYATKEDYDVCLKILKLILEKSPSDEYARKEIVDIYRKKYTEHTYLEEYIRKSNLEGAWRNINDAISNFERHIAFDKGNFVFHRTWGIGRITDVSKDVFTIDFHTKKEHKMSLNMALDSLKNLPKNHIWILKIKDIKRLKKTIKEDIVWGLKILINSYDNRATMKNFKEELVPDVLTASEWNTWWNNAKKVLKTDPKFGTLDDASDVFEMRDKPLSFEEKTYNSFKALKDFNQRFALLLDFIENAEPDSEYLEDMVQYFVSFTNTTNSVNEQTICSYLMVEDIINRYSFLSTKITLNYSFKDYFDNIEEPIKIYENISFSDYKREYLIQIKKCYPKWDEIYINIFYIYPHRFIFDELINKDKKYFEKIVKEITLVYKEYKDAFFWVVVNALTEDKIKESQIDFDSIVFSMIHLIDITAKDINNKKDVTKNKKISNQIKDYLFKNGFLVNYIEKSDKEFAKRLYTIINELYVLEGEHIALVRNRISQKFPDIDTEDESLKYDDSKAKSSIMDKLLTTEESYKGVQKEIGHIKDVEIPENSKEIGWAMEKGDLKENAEFKAAKEKQAYLQNRLTKLINDLSRATVIKNEDIKNTFVTFGTEVTLLDKINNSKIVYTIMGPWESDTEKNIISYQSPFGSKFLDKKVKDEVKFKLNEKSHHYIVEKISVAKF